jgi:signal transduction histidine kinase/CheY-like chemotaxis protein
MFLAADQNSVIIGLFAFVLSVSLALQNEVTETKHQIVLQNEELEGKVASRTRDLEEQTEIAVGASKTKSRFLATMSHEIRTPMNAIIGISDILVQRSDLQDDVREGIERIRHSGKNLLGIINDILDLSKAESGKLEIVPTEFFLPSLINDTALLNIVRIGSKPIVFTMSLSNNIPEKLIGDELRIKQILNNILSNAFKYTDKGSVKFDISGEMSDKHFLITFTVSDTGQGIREEELKTLFDEYSRFNKIANRKTEGTGLGMNITSQLISLMGGTIDVKSTFGEGSTFTVMLPLEFLQNTAAISEETIKRLCNFTFAEAEKIGERRDQVRDYMPYGKVLIVDDVETNLYVANGLLKPYGVNVTTALSGFEAIKIINSGNSFDIIFMDHMMPEMDGIETVKKIREMGYKLPIAALTANAIIGNETIFKDSGFDDYISKPIDVRELNRILIKFIRDRHPEQGKIKPSKNDRMPHNINDKILEIFIKDARKAVVNLSEQFENKDYKNLAITAHGMKSAAANAGEEEVSEIAKKLEFAAKRNDIETVSITLPELQKKLKQIIDDAKTAEDTESNDKQIISETEQKELLTKAAAHCADYDERNAAAVIAKMREFELTDDILKLLENVEVLLLHAEFEEAEAKIAEKLKGQNETSVYN